MRAPLWMRLKSWWRRRKAVTVVGWDFGTDRSVGVVMRHYPDGQIEVVKILDSSRPPEAELGSEVE